MSVSPRELRRPFEGSRLLNCLLNPEHPNGDNGCDHSEAADRPACHIGRAIRPWPLNHRVAPMVHDSLRYYFSPQGRSQGKARGSKRAVGKRVDFVAQVASQSAPLLTPVKCRVTNIHGAALWMRRNTRLNEGQIGKATFECNRAGGVGRKAWIPEPARDRAVAAKRKRRRLFPRARTALCT